jgi:RNA polymerase sigma factor (sigma-70 family)
MTTQITPRCDVPRELVKLLHRRALKLIRSESDAWDLVQDALERGLRRWPRIPPLEVACRWFSVVLRNRHLDCVRSADWRVARRPSPQAIEEIGAPEPGEVPMWQSVDREQLDQAIDRLPSCQREVLLMQLRDDLSLNEIARVLRVRPSTAGTRAHRARNRLRTILLEDASQWLRSGESRNLPSRAGVGGFARAAR